MQNYKGTTGRVKKYLESLAYDNEFKELLIEDVGLLHNELLEGESINPDSCTINWDDDIICGLDDFLDAYFQSFIHRTCNILDSFAEEGAK